MLHIGQIENGHILCENFDRCIGEIRINRGLGSKGKYFHRKIRSAAAPQVSELHAF